MTLFYALLLRKMWLSQDLVWWAEAMSLNFTPVQEGKNIRAYSPYCMLSYKKADECVEVLLLQAGSKAYGHTHCNQRMSPIENAVSSQSKSLFYREGSEAKATVTLIGTKNLSYREGGGTKPTVTLIKTKNLSCGRVSEAILRSHSSWPRRPSYGGVDGAKAIVTLIATKNFSHERGGITSPVLD